MVIQMDKSLETKYSSLPAFYLPGSQMREKKKPTKLKTGLGSNLKELATVKQWFLRDSPGWEPHILADLFLEL